MNHLSLTSVLEYGVKGSQHPWMGKCPSFTVVPQIHLSENFILGVVMLTFSWGILLNYQLNKDLNGTMSQLLNFDHKQMFYQFPYCLCYLISLQTLMSLLLHSLRTYFTAFKLCTFTVIADVFLFVGKKKQP